MNFNEFVEKHGLSAYTSDDEEALDDTDAAPYSADIELRYDNSREFLDSEVGVDSEGNSSCDNFFPQDLSKFSKETYNPINQNHLKLSKIMRQEFETHPKLWNAPNGNYTVNEWLKNTTKSELSTEYIFDVSLFRVLKLETIINRRVCGRQTPINQTCYWASFSDAAIGREYRLPEISSKSTNLVKHGPEQYGHVLESKQSETLTYTQKMTKIIKSCSKSQQSYGFHSCSNFNFKNINQNFISPFPITSNFLVQDDDKCDDKHEREVLLKVCPQVSGHSFNVIENPVVATIKDNKPLPDSLCNSIITFEIKEEPIGGLILTKKFYFEGKLLDTEANGFFDTGISLSFKKSERNKGWKMTIHNGPKWPKNRN